MSEKSRELHNKWLEARDKWLDYHKEIQDNDKARHDELANLPSNTDYSSSCLLTISARSE